MSTLGFFLASSWLLTTLIETSGDSPGTATRARRWEPPALQHRYEDADLGITQFVLPEDGGIGGIFKWRWTDFRVNERRADGSTVRLFDDQSLPEQPWPLLDSFDDFLFHMEQALPEAASRKLQAAWPRREAWSATAEQILRSAKRVQVCCLQTESLEEGERMRKTMSSYSWKKSHVKCVVKEENGQVRIYMTRRSTAPQAQVLSCTLTKCGWDTLSIIRELSFILRIPSSSITYAGVKDKAAITEQLLSFENISPRRLLSLNNSSRIAGIRLGNLRYESNAVKIGSHSGNCFTILLRHVTESPERIRTSVMSLASSGFVNYFGHQRFGDGGGSGLPPIEVGKLLLSGRWSQVIKAMMNPNCVRSESEREAKKAFMQSRRSDALRLLPRSCHDERVALQNLLRGSPDSQTCRSLPHRTLFMCAYWSHVWNRLASYRIEKLGNTLAVGDLVKYTTSPGDGDEGDFNLKDPADISISPSEAIHIVQEQDIRDEKFSVFDIVLPLPGKGVTMLWPHNDAGDFVKNVLREDGLLNAVLNPFAPSGFCVFRNLFMRPQNLKFKVLRYSNGTDGIICGNDPRTGEVSYFGTEKLRKHKKAGRKSWFALQLRFNLPSNVFATMALRELCKVHGGVVEQYKRRKDAEDVEAKISKPLKKKRLRKILTRMEKKGIKEDWRTKLADQLASWRTNGFHSRAIREENIGGDDRM